MKRKKLEKKLVLRKNTIANMETMAPDKARGGVVTETEPGPWTCLPRTCGGTCYQNTCEYSCGDPITCNGGPC